jgi:hypothetical protein
MYQELAKGAPCLSQTGGEGPGSASYFSHVDFHGNEFDVERSSTSYLKRTEIITADSNAGVMRAENFREVCIKASLAKAGPMKIQSAARRQ